MTGSIRLVCFDIGGVVVRICRSRTEGCAAAGVDVREPARWDEVKAARLALVHRHQVGRIDGTTFAEEISALWGGLYSPAEIMGIHRAWLLDEYEGIGDLIDAVLLIRQVVGDDRGLVRSDRDDQLPPCGFDNTGSAFDCVGECIDVLGGQARSGQREGVVEPAIGADGDLFVGIVADGDISPGLGCIRVIG